MDIKDKLLLGISATTFATSAYFFQQKDYALDEINRGPAIGRLETISNIVKQKPKGTLAWLDADGGQNLYFNDQIFTHDESYAKLNLRNELTLNLSPNTLIKLGKDLDSLDLNLSQGFFSIDIKQNKSKKFQVSLGGKKIAIDSQNAKLQVQSTGHTNQLYLKDGKAQVSSGNKLHQIDAGTTIIPKGAVVSVKIDALMAAFPYLEPKEVQQLFKLNPTIDVDQLKTLLVKGNKLSDLIFLYQIAPKTDFSSLVRISKFEKIRFVTALLKKRPHFSIDQLEAILKSDDKITIQDIDKTLSIKPDLDLNEIVAITEKQKNITPSDILITHQLRPKASYSSITEILNSSLSLQEINRLFRRNPQLQFENIKDIQNAYPKINANELAILSRSQQVAHIPSISQSISSKHLATIIDSNPNADLLKLREYLQVNKKISPALLGETFKINPNISLKSLSSLLNSNQGFTHSDINNILKSNPAISFDKLAKITTTLPPAQIKGLVSYLEENPSSDLAALDGSLKTNPSININKKSDRKKLKLIVASNTRNDAFNKKRFAEFKKENPQYSDKTLLGLMAVSPTLTAKALRNYTQANPKTKPDTLKSFLTVAPESNLQKISSLQKDYPEASLENLTKIFRQNPNISSDDLATIFKNRTDLSADLLSANISGIKDTTSFGAILAENKQVPLTTLYSFSQRFPQASLAALRKLLKNDPSANVEAFAPVFEANPQTNLESFVQLQKKYPQLKTTHLQNILTQNPKISANDLSSIFKAAPTTKGTHLETIFVLGKNIQPAELTEFLTSQKKYGIKDLIPLFAVVPAASPLDVLSALKRDKKLTLNDIVTSVQTNPSLHIKYVTHNSIEKAQKGDDLIIIKQKVQPKDAPALYRIDVEDKIKLSWDSNSKTDKSIVLIASDPQFQDIVKKVPVTHLKNRQTSDINSKIAEILPLMKKSSSKIKANDLPSIIAINPALPAKDFIELLQEAPQLDAPTLKAILTLKPDTNLKDLKVALSGRNAVSPQTIRTILAINNQIDVKDIADILKVRKDISEKELTRNVSTKINFKDYKDILINFPKILPSELNQTINNNPRIDLRNLYSLLKLQPSLTIHQLNNTTLKYKQVKPSELKAIVQKRPDTSTQSINSIMDSNRKLSLQPLQELVISDPTASMGKLAAVFKQNPDFEIDEFKKLLLKHPHLRAEELLPIFISHPQISIKRLNKTFAKNSTLTPRSLHQVLIQHPELSFEDLTRLLQASPSVDIKNLPPLLAASSSLKMGELIRFLEQNPQIEFTEITPVLTLKPNLDFDDWNTALKKHPNLKSHDIVKHFLLNSRASMGGAKPSGTITDEEIAKINSIISDYAQINRSQLELVIRSNPLLNINQYKELLDSEISTVDLHKILLIKPKSDLTQIAALNKKFDLEQIQILISNHPNISLSKLIALPKETPISQLDETLTNKKDFSFQDYTRFIRTNDDLDARDTLITLANHPQISLLRLKELYSRAPNTDIKLIDQAFNANPKFPLQDFIKMLKLHPNRKVNPLLSLLATNPEIPLPELTEFINNNKTVQTSDLVQIYQARQHIHLSELTKALSLAPRLKPSQIAALLHQNTHVKLYQLNQLMRSHPRLTEKQITSLATTLQFDQVATVLHQVPISLLLAAIEATPNVNLSSLQSLVKTHPNLSPKDLKETLTLSPAVNLEHVSIFLAKNPRYQIYDVNDLLEINPNIDLLTLSEIHQSNPEAEKSALKKLLFAAPFISLTKLAATSKAIPKGQFQAFSSFIQENPATNLDAFNKLLENNPQLDIAKISQMAKSNYGITVEDIYGEISKNPKLSLASPQLMQSILSKKQMLQVGGLQQGSYYWKVSSQIEDVEIESPVTAFRIELGTIPVPLYPKNNVEILTTNFERSVRLRWEKQDAAEYQLELTYWDESDKISTSQIYHTKNNYLDLKDLATRKYSWKVRVADKERPNATWSKANSFIIKNRPFFIPQYPAVDEKIIVNSKFPAIQFKWKGIDNTPYVVTLATDKNFRNIVLNKTVKMTSFTWKKPIPGRFYWKLALTSNDLQSPYVQPIEIYCSPIRLVSPVKNQKLVLYKRRQEMEFTWNNTTPVSLKKERPQYIVELSNTADFKDIITKKKTSTNRIKISFSKPQKYFWRIKLKNPSKYDTPSISTPFEVKLSPPPAPPVIKKSIIQQLQDNQVYSPQKSSSPSRSIASEDFHEDYKNTYVDIEWYKVDYVAGYVIEIYRDIGLTDLVHRAKTEEHHYRWKAAVPGHFYYRLASYDYWARQSPFTPAETMTITVPRATPRLLEPKPDGIRIINRSGGMKFSWTKVKFTSKYQWELSRDQKFDKIVLTKEVEDSDTHNISLPKNLITDIGFHFWRVRSNFPIGEPLTSEIRRVSLENVMEFDHDLYITGFGYVESITETTEQDDTYFASEGTVNKGFQLGGSVEYILTGKKLEYGRYKKKFQLSNELTIKTVMNHQFDLPMLEYTLKEKFVSNNFSLWGYNPAFIAAFEKSSHLSARDGGTEPKIQETMTFLLGLGITKEYFLFERKLDAFFEILTPLYFSTSEKLYAIPISSLKIFLRGRYNVWGPLDIGLDLSYAFYNNLIEYPFTHRDFFLAGTLTIKLF